MEGIRSLRNSSIKSKKLCNVATLPLLEDIYIDKKSDKEISKINIKKVGIIRPESFYIEKTSTEKNHAAQYDSVALQPTQDKSKALVEHNVVIDFDDLIRSKEQELEALKSKSTEDLKNFCYSDSPLVKYSSRLTEYHNLENKTNKAYRLIKNHKIIVASGTVGLFLILSLVFLYD